MENKYTIITGASCGIGFELAKLFAKNNFNLIIISRNKTKLEEVKTNLEKINENILIKILPLDLSKDSSKVIEYVKKNKINVENLINNAGFGSYGDFKNLNIEDELNMLNLNILSVVKITHDILPQIIKNKGKILNVASTAAFQPIPKMASYSASKSFVLSFSVALNEELKKFGVTVTALCPGATKTNFDKRAKMNKSILFNSNLSNIMSANKVAKIGFDKMMRGKTIVITGKVNYIGTLFSKMMPIKTMAKIITRLV